jgi:autotransporter-associated beta strand protein
LTLNDDTIVRVWDTGADLGRISAVAINSLVGANMSLTKIGNRTLELAGDNTSTFTGGSITVSQGTLRVRDNGALGASTTTTIERNSALEIAVSNFTPSGGSTINQIPGSVERWNVEDARGTNYNLPAGVNLQLDTNLISGTPRTIGLNGGSVEGFLYTDHVAPADERTIGSAVTLNLLADSYVGQNILQGQGYDTGRGPTVGQPFGDNITGAILRIEGQITGARNLTKTGLDTVVLANSSNSYGNTVVEMGTLRIGALNALPTSGTLTTRTGGTFDLYGNDQTVAGLGTVDGGPNPGGTGLGSAGRLINSAPVDNTLTVNNTANYTYNGTIERNVALTKSGSGTLTLTAANTYAGPTTISGGNLVLTGSISGTPSIDVQAGAGFNVSGVPGGFTLLAKQTLKGGGTVTGTVDIDGAVSPTAGSSALAITGNADFDPGATFALALNSASSYGQLSAAGVSLDGTVTLTLALNYTPAPFTSFTIVNNTGVTPVGGTTGLLTWGGPEGVLSEGEIFLVGAQEFSITYAGGSGGNDIILTTIPEPGSITALCAGLGVLCGLRRIRRRR